VVFDGHDTHGVLSELKKCNRRIDGDSATGSCGWSGWLPRCGMGEGLPTRCADGGVAI
jgi:hypothetical protein